MESLDLTFWEFNPLSNTEPLDIPDNPSAGWCDMVSEYYGRNGYKVVITADSFMREKPMVGSMGGHRRLTIEKPLGDSGNDDTHAFYGVFFGLELRPDIESENNYIPFARMGGVIDLTTDIEVASEKEQDVLIPIRNTKNLLLLRS